MNLHFSKPTIHQPFLPRQLANSTPSPRKTLRECEDGGEAKLCATSLESMIDFATSVLGKEVATVSTESSSSGKRTYRIEAVRRLPSERAVVVCHQLEYAYAVFYCHSTDTTVAYAVSLEGAEAVAVCHRDTAEWNPKHLAFEALKVKPGVSSDLPLST